MDTCVNKLGEHTEGNAAIKTGPIKLILKKAKEEGWKL